MEYIQYNPTIRRLYSKKTRESHDFTQQTFGNLKFGQESQKSDTSLEYIQYNPTVRRTLYKKPGNLNDFTQQTSGKLEC